LILNTGVLDERGDKRAKNLARREKEEENPLYLKTS
jgi:hypothetical protein